MKRGELKTNLFFKSDELHKSRRREAEGMEWLLFLWFEGCLEGWALGRGGERVGRREVCLGGGRFVWEGEGGGWLGEGSVLKGWGGRRRGQGESVLKGSTSVLKGGGLF